ncbi:MAG: hypothetical protein KJ042_12440 [Deltaproteobacteria bacterium]|nr:hypothetical protein [Deltaproteobacteria bacterium]
MRAALAIALTLVAATVAAADVGVSAPPPFQVREFAHAFEGAVEDTATGDFYRFAHRYAPIPIEPKFTHALTFQMSEFFPARLEAMPGSAPLVLYADDLDTIVFSPLDRFYASLIEYRDGEIRYGIQGDVRRIPDGFDHRFILVRGKGLNATIAHWGERLRAHAGKQPVDRYADTGLSYLGYWTDAGAAYYWNTLPGKNAHDTLLAVKAEADRRGIPYRYFQIDSWWYYTKRPGLVVRGSRRWAPRPDVFPRGLTAFREQLGLPLIAHTRFFAPDNDHAREFPFVKGPRVAIPLGRAFYDRIMSDAKSWGIETYEQDWLMNQVWWSDHLRSGVDHTSRWLANMDAAAADRGLTMQICMAGPAHVMDAVNRRSWTTVRSSIDYRPELAKEAYWPQFHIANMLVSAVGLLPFKDNFRTAETHGEAEALISALSAGMVGPSDEVDRQDAALLLRTCRADGLLLKPDRPATPIDAMFLPHARPFITATHSRREGLGTWTYLAAYHFARRNPERTFRDRAYASGTYDLRKMTRYFVFPDRVTDWRVDLARDLGIGAPVVVYDWRTGAATVARGAFDLAAVDGLYDFAYVVLAPILQNGLALIGEPGKFVTLADRRFARIEPRPGEVDLTLVGAPGEIVRVRAFDTSTGAMLPDAIATIGAEGSVDLTITRAADAVREGH